MLKVKEDTIFNLSYLWHCKNVFSFDEPLYFYRIRKDRSNTVATATKVDRNYFLNKIGLSKARQKLRAIFNAICYRDSSMLHEIK